MISTAIRSWTHSTCGTTGATGNGTDSKSTVAGWMHSGSSVRMRPNRDSFALWIEFRPIKSRHVDKGKAFGHLEEHRFTVAGGFFQANPLVADRGQCFFAVADDEQVEKTGHRFGMERARPAGNDQRMIHGPVFRRQGDAAQIEHRQHVAVGKIVLQGKAQHVELPKRRE